MEKIWEISKMFLLSAIIISVFQLAVLQFSAQSAVSISRFISTNNATINLNSSISIPFSVNITSGNPGTTYLIIADGQALAANGIYVGLSPGSGNPNFTGKIYINTNVNPSKVVPGIYGLIVESGGADPIYPGRYNITLTVVSTAKAPTFTVASTTIGEASTIRVQSETSSGSSHILSMLAGIGILIVLVAILLVGRYNK